MKALVGSWEQRPYRLLAELTALRSRVRDLEQELQRVREDNTLLRAENDQLQAMHARDVPSDLGRDELPPDERIERDVVMSS